MNHGLKMVLSWSACISHGKRDLFGGNLSKGGEIKHTQIIEGHFTGLL